VTNNTNSDSEGVVTGKRIHNIGENLMSDIQEGKVSLLCVFSYVQQHYHFVIITCYRYEKIRGVMVLSCVYFSSVFNEISDHRILTGLTYVILCQSQAVID
jgi:hypothetical protein